MKPKIVYLALIRYFFFDFKISEMKGGNFFKNNHSKKVLRRNMAPQRHKKVFFVIFDLQMCSDLLLSV